MSKVRIYYGGLVGHTDVNANERRVGDARLRNMIFESASQVASATDPVVKGSIAHGIWGSQKDAVLDRYYEIAAECERRDIPVVQPEDTSSHREFRARRAARIAARKAS